MTPKHWMVLTWAAILIAVVGVCAEWGGRHCEVPKSGPFHRILSGHEYVIAHTGRIACIEVK